MSGYGDSDAAAERTGLMKYGLRLVTVWLLAGTLIACSSGGPKRGTPAPGKVPVDPRAAVRTRHLDSAGMLEARRVRITVLPGALVKDLKVDALHHEWRDEGSGRKLFASGNVVVRLRGLTIHTAEFEASVAEDEPVGGLRVLAEGEARYLSATVGSPPERAAFLVLSPDRIHYGAR